VHPFLTPLSTGNITHLHQLLHRILQQILGRIRELGRERNSPSLVCTVGVWAPRSADTSSLQNDLLPLYHQLNDINIHMNWTGLCLVFASIHVLVTTMILFPNHNITLVTWTSNDNPNLKLQSYLVIWHDNKL
jgi:hypothetical protein